jgi:hypothetical protein
VKLLYAISLFLATAYCVHAQNQPTAATSAWSVSGQFLVIAPPPSGKVQTKVTVTTNADWIRIEPTLVAISAERVKQAVWRELGVTGLWRQKVTIALRPALTDDELVTIISVRAPDGWSYRVEMADQLSRERYLRALVQVVLLELANRSIPERGAEIPTWFSEGLVFEFLSNSSTELILTTPGATANGVAINVVATDTRRFSPLEKAHKILVGTVPLTFEELSWPASGLSEDAEGARFRASSQLLIRELLQLPTGQACMRNFVTSLPSFLNWQIAFLQSFKPYFNTTLDIEKWWTLQASAFAGRDLIHTWTYEESWNRLAAALREPVDVFANTNDLPTHSEVTLQTIIHDWAVGRQREALPGKVSELDALRMRIAPELAPLAAEYSKVLRSYLNEPAFAPQSKMTSAAVTPNKQARQQTIQVLDALDLKLRNMRLTATSDTR